MPWKFKFINFLYKLYEFNPNYSLNIWKLVLAVSHFEILVICLHPFNLTIFIYHHVIEIPNQFIFIGSKHVDFIIELIQFLFVLFFQTSNNRLLSHVHLIQ